MLKKKFEAQVLVVVIMVLLLLSMIVIGIVAVVTRDVEQSVGSREYEASYNKSEEKMNTILDKYADVSVDLSGLVSDPNLSCSGAADLGFKCTFSEEDLMTQVSVDDTNEVVDFDLGKDETFKVRLDNSYRDNITFTWTGQVALEFTLEFKRGSEYSSFKDVYDKDGIFTTSGTSSSHHVFQFIANDPTRNEVVLNVGDALQVSDIPLYLKVKALMKDGIATQLSIKGENSSFPDQIREVEGVSYYQDNTASSSAPVLITQIPLAGFEPEILNYVLRTENNIVK